MDSQLANELASLTGKKGNLEILLQNRYLDWILAKILTGKDRKEILLQARYLQWITVFKYYPKEDIQDFLLSVATVDYYKEFLKNIEEFTTWKFDNYKTIAEYSLDEWCEHNKIVNRDDKSPGISEFNNDPAEFKNQKRIWREASLIFEKGYNSFLVMSLHNAKIRYYEILDKVVESLGIDFFTLKTAIAIKKFRIDTKLLLHFEWDGRSQHIILSKQFIKGGSLPSIKFQNVIGNKNIFKEYLSTANTGTGVVERFLKTPKQMKVRKKKNS